MTWRDRLTLKGVQHLRYATQLLLEAAVKGRNSDLASNGISRSAKDNVSRETRRFAVQRRGSLENTLQQARRFISGPTFCSAVALRPNVASQLSDFLCSNAATKASGATLKLKPEAAAVYRWEICVRLEGYHAAAMVDALPRDKQLLHGDRGRPSPCYLVHAVAPETLIIRGDKATNGNDVGLKVLLESNAVAPARIHPAAVVCGTMALETPATPQHTHGSRGAGMIPWEGSRSRLQKQRGRWGYLGGQLSGEPTNLGEVLDVETGGVALFDQGSEFAL